MRKQAAEKDASKCLIKIRKLLQAYALARPNVRIQYRVLKAKNDKVNLMYGPKQGEASVRDAAWKVVGSEPASQCSWSVLEVGPYELQAFLPVPEAVAAKISNVGHFLSIDARPVATTRGTPKQICKLVMEKMRNCSAALANVKDPFFVLNIVCPQGSYDPNVEPAKDDVLFHDANMVLAAVEELLSAVYPTSATNNAVRKTVEDADIRTAENGPQTGHNHGEILPEMLLEEMIEDDEDLMQDLTSTKESSALISGSATDGIESNAGHPQLEVDHYEEPVANTNELEVLENRANIWRSNMYDFDEDDIDLSVAAAQQHEQGASEDFEMEEIDKRDLNPWTIAKMNMARRAGKSASAASAVITNVPRARPRSLSPVQDHPVLDCGGLPTFSPMLHEQRAEMGIISHRAHSEELSFMNAPVPAAEDRDRVIMRGGLPRPHASSSPTRPPAQHWDRPEGWDKRQKQANRTLEKAFQIPSQSRNHEMSAGIDNHRPTKRSKAPRNGNGAHRQQQLPWQPATGPNRLPLGPPVTFPNSLRLGVSDEPEDAVPTDAEVEDDFRSRLRQAGQQLDSSYAARPAAPQFVPASKQHRAPIAAQSGWTPINATQQQQPDIGPPPSTQRRRTTESRRTKSSRLPLERVPDGCAVHNLVQRIELPPNKLESLMFWFAEPSVNESGFEFAAADAPCTSLLERFADREMCRASVKAVDLPQLKLETAEELNDEKIALMFEETLSRLEQPNDAMVE